MFMETFAERLRYARHRAKLSQDELARKVDCTKSTLSKAAEQRYWKWIAEWDQK